jgi:cell division protein FtsW
LYAIASGGLWGKVLGQSMQKLGFIPESHNDMIFSVICEELGIVGGLAIILLYVLLLWRLFVVAVNAKDLFGSLICVGIMVHIAMQVLINIAVVTNTMPSTGIPLPFISYGGSSLVALLFEMGIALGVSNQIEYRE